MVSPLGAPVVLDLIHQGFDPVIHLLWPFYVDGEPSELTIDELHFCDLGDLVTVMRRLEGIPNLLGALQPVNLVVFFPTQRDK